MAPRTVRSMVARITESLERTALFDEDDGPRPRDLVSWLTLVFGATVLAGVTTLVSLTIVHRP